MINENSVCVCDMGPLHYLVLVGAEHVLPQIFARVLTPPALARRPSSGGEEEAVAF
jgi:hypothetical protein